MLPQFTFPAWYLAGFTPVIIRVRSLLETKA